MTIGTAQRRLREAIDAAAALLAEAGVNSPRADATELAAYAAGIDRSRLLLAGGLGESPGADFYSRYDGLVAARARRIPLQHLTGRAAFGAVTVHVGPGVFVPRPETESMLEWATQQELSETPVIVDLCTGSGALALALSRHWPAARVIAVDDAPEALSYARRNLEPTPVELRCADVTTPGLWPELDGEVDLVVANPPYIPAGARLEPEVADHDPAHALFGGPDGMAVIAALPALAARWLRPGGRCAVEHDDSTALQTVAAFTDSGQFCDVMSRRDLAGRPRFVTATRADVTSEETM